MVAPGRLGTIGFGPLVDDWLWVFIIEFNISWEDDEDEEDEVDNVEALNNRIDLFDSTLSGCGADNSDVWSNCMIGMLKPIGGGLFGISGGGWEGFSNTVTGCGIWSFKYGDIDGDGELENSLGWIFKVVKDEEDEDEVVVVESSSVNQ